MDLADTRAIAARLRVEREARGWYKPEMARRLRDALTGSQRPSLNTMLSYIKRWEAARNGVTERYRFAYAAVFEMSIAELFGPDGPSQPSQGHELPLDAPLVSNPLATGSVKALVPPHARDDDVKRRAALQLFAALGAGAAIPPGALEEIFAGIDKALGTPVDLAEWERAVHEYPHLMNTRSEGSLIRDLTADVLAVGHHLERPHPPLIQAGLLRVSAGLSGLLADSLDTVGQRRAARVAWGAARRAADASGDGDLSVWVRAREAQVAFWADRSDQIVRDLADEAVQLAGRRPSIGLARAHAALAIVAARRGDATTAHAALARGTEVTDRGVTGPVGAWDEKNQLWTEGYIRVLLDDFPQRALEQALARFPAGTLGPVTNLHLMTALSLVQTGEIDDGLGHAVTSLRHGDPAGNMRRVLVGQIVAALPAKAHALPGVQELKALTAAPAALP